MSSLVSREAFLVLQLKEPVVNKLRTKIPGAGVGVKQIDITNTFYINITLIYCVIVCFILSV